LFVLEYYTIEDIILQIKLANNHFQKIKIIVSLVLLIAISIKILQLSDNKVTNVMYKIIDSLNYGGILYIAII